MQTQTKWGETPPYIQPCIVTWSSQVKSIYL